MADADSRNSEGLGLFTFYKKSRKNGPILSFAAFSNIFISRRSWNYWRGMALIMFLFLLMMTAVASGVDTTNSAGENVPVGDRIPSNCHSVDSCLDCLCQIIGGKPFCCDG